MSKKLFIIALSIVLGLFLTSLVGYYFILQSSNATEPGGISSTFRNFFPFGNNTSTTTEIVEPITTEPNQSGQPQNYTQKLRKLSSEPVAGAGLLDVKAGTLVRHIEKATGHIYETELFSPNQNRISNTTIPLTYDAIWGNKNNALVARYLTEDNKTIETYGLLIKNVSTSTENTMSAVKLLGNIDEVSVFENSVFTLEQKDTSSVGYISGFDGTKRTQVWNSPIKELLSQYVSAKTIALTTKPHQDNNGFLFFVDTGNGQMKKILGGVLGLSTLVDNQATRVLYLDQTNTPGLFVFDIKNKLSKDITPTTFPEKCVWGKKNAGTIYCAVPEEFIDRDSLTSWYLGFVSFTDNIWKYDLKNNTSSLVGSLYTESEKQIDVIKPLLSENEQYFVFINKVDGSLWSYDLTK
ncbi:MAG TPA: hypothetical protein DEV73_00120 [Candidatus Zambryskibacteria bacterium]|nr:hypothetical protein [Candidatus Zambryskibacteria bacterium]